MINTKKPGPGDEVEYQQQHLKAILRIKSEERYDVRVWEEGFAKFEDYVFTKETQAVEFATKRIADCETLQQARSRYFKYMIDISNHQGPSGR